MENVNGQGVELFDYEKEDREPWTARQKRLNEMGERLRMRPEDAEVFVRAGMEESKIPKHPYMRRQMLKYLRKHEVKPPMWLLLSGLWPECEGEYFGNDRRVRIRKIYSAAVLLIRKELKRHELDENRSERSVFWDPVVDVCRGLGLAPSKLSAFCRELTGNNLAQVIDNVRAEGLAKRMREEVRGLFGHVVQSRERKGRSQRHQEHKEATKKKRRRSGRFGRS